ncbi:MBL fold metallo-hydrolase [Patescibacteria group bacterium]|nr:MBL fold metallo-hydrolase [Patescibacteria group bacterium]
MQISWKGKLEFKIISNNNTIIINPSKKQKADIIINPGDFNFEKDSFLIYDPGEYEINEDFIYKNSYKKEDEEYNDIYRILSDNLSIVILKNIDLKLSSIPERISNGIIGSKQDILIIEVSEEFNAKDATQIVNEVEPKIVIPIFNLEEEKIEKAKTEFCSKFSCVNDPTDKLKINVKNFNQEEIEVFLLEKDK